MRSRTPSSSSAPSTDQVEAARYTDLSRGEWARLRDSTPLPISEAQLQPLGGLIEPVSVSEVIDVYLPLSRLINLYASATRRLRESTTRFLGRETAHAPYVIGIAGSVAVGKSTASRVLRALLSHWPDHPRVDLVTTDGFLLPQRELEARGLARRKGFPESYDLRRLLRFLADVKSGVADVEAPVYSHVAYDIVAGEFHHVRQPDILIVEGLNVLQTGSGRGGRGPHMFVSDFFDFTLYIDAAETDVEQWYVERFLKLRATVFQSPSSYFHRYATLDDTEAEHTARQIWRTINLVNLRENVAPTRERAHLILEKGRDHAVRRVRLRKV